MKKIILLLLSSVLLSGCVTNQLDFSQLIKHQFILTAVDGKAVQLHLNIRPYISFDADLKINGVMCNRFLGQGKLKHERLSVFQLVSTRMLCSNTELNQWEQIILLMLRQGAKANITQNTLIIKGNGHILKYQMRQLPVN